MVVPFLRICNKYVLIIKIPVIKTIRSNRFMGWERILFHATICWGLIVSNSNMLVYNKWLIPTPLCLSICDIFTLTLINNNSALSYHKVLPKVVNKVYYNIFFIFSVIWGCIFLGPKALRKGSCKPTAGARKRGGIGPPNL